jgi:hypothetical protein
MAPATRTKTRTAKESFAFILDSILDLNIDSPVRFGLDELGVVNLEDLMDIDKQSLEDVEFSNQNNEKVKFKKLDIIRILKIQQWYADQTNPTSDTWSMLTKDEYDIWKNNFTVRGIQGAPVIPATTVSPSITTIPATVSPAIATTNDTAVRQFQRGIKLSVSEYPKLKEDKFWRTWSRSMKTIANMHGTNNILDPLYIPKPEDAALFLVHQNFMYTMLEQCVVTSKGKLHVRAHASDQDAQKVYAKLLLAYEDSISIQFAATTARTELITLRLDDKWNRSCESFLITLESQNP